MAPIIEIESDIARADIGDWLPNKFYPQGRELQLPDGKYAYVTQDHVSSSDYNIDVSSGILSIFEGQDTAHTHANKALLDAIDDTVLEEEDIGVKFLQQDAHTQSSASNQWIVTHSLNVQFPKVRAFIGGEEVFDLDVDFINNSELHLNWADAYTGSVILEKSY